MDKDINKFKQCYQHRTNLEEDERGDVVAERTRSLNRRKNLFCQLLNVYWADGVRRTETHTAELCESESSASKAEIATENL
jgi:hypothetical protein